MVTFYKYTNQGGRKINEDNCGIACNGDNFCFVVADGLGGHGGGDVASRMAVDAVCDTFAVDGWSEHFFSDAFALAQKNILTEQERLHTPSRMKTTLVILVLSDGKIHWAHVGDSRLYYFKGTRIKKRTIDHSVPQMLALSGEIKDEDIRHHPDRNRLIRVMGNRGEKPRFEEENPIKLSGTQYFLLCTDGWWELVDEQYMEQSLKNNSALEGWVQQMEREIQKNGQGSEMDNYTCIVIKSHQKGLFGR